MFNQRHSSGKLPIVKVLIERGADIDYQELGKLRNALMLAAKNGHNDVVNELLQRGSVVNIVDKFNMTALMYASKGGHVDAMRTLLLRGGGANYTDTSGED
jgi:ankyrin repeat protein